MTLGSKGGDSANCQSRTYVAHRDKWLSRDGDVIVPTSPCSKLPVLSLQSAKNKHYTTMKDYLPSRTLGSQLSVAILSPPRIPLITDVTLPSMLDSESTGLLDVEI